jgi:pimeloyl-ACP methyl ester carboxylesterase
VTYDQRGIGRSSSPQADPANYTLVKYAEDLDAVRQVIGVESVHLLGHSWGGIVAQRYATLYPERVRSVILMGSGPPTREQTLQCQDALIQRMIALIQEGIISENPERAALKQREVIYRLTFPILISGFRQMTWAARQSSMREQSRSMI